MFERATEQVGSDEFTSGYYEGGGKEPKVLAQEIVIYMGKAKGGKEETARRGKAVMEWMRTATHEDGTLPSKIADELHKMQGGETVAELIRSSVTEAR